MELVSQKWSFKVSTFTMVSPHLSTISPYINLLLWDSVKSVQYNPIGLRYWRNSPPEGNFSTPGSSLIRCLSLDLSVPSPLPHNF